MGRGRPKKSAARKLAEGNAGRRTSADLTPKPKPGRPDCPPGVTADPVAKDRWNWICDQLEQMGILTTADQLVIEILASDYSELAAARQQVKKFGLLLQGAKGGQYINPAQSEVNAAKARIRQGIEALGLSPRAREQLNVTPAGEKKSVMDEFLEEFDNPRPKPKAKRPARKKK